MSILQATALHVLDVAPRPPVEDGVLRRLGATAVHRRSFDGTEPWLFS